jgi:hypothetical protein
MQPEAIKRPDAAAELPHELRHPHALRHTRRWSLQSERVARREGGILKRAHGYLATNGWHVEHRQDTSDARWRAYE